MPLSVSPSAAKGFYLFIHHPFDFFRRHCRLAGAQLHLVDKLQNALSSLAPGFGGRRGEG
jgi:hypothetical protein